MNVFRIRLSSALCAVLLVMWGHVAGASTISYTYDPAGRLVAADYGMNRTTSYAYDNAGNLLQSARPAPGFIILGLTGTQLTLAWPAIPGGFVLQSATAIGSGALWINVNAISTQSGNLKTVTLTVNGTSFYRLKK